MSKVKACMGETDAYGNPQKHDFSAGGFVLTCVRCDIHAVEAYEAERYDHQELRNDLKHAVEAGLGLMAADPLKAIVSRGQELRHHHFSHHQSDLTVRARLKELVKAVNYDTSTWAGACSLVEAAQTEIDAGLDASLPPPHVTEAMERLNALEKVVHASNAMIAEQLRILQEMDHEVSPTKKVP